jgi:hypothetical protein
MGLAKMALVLVAQPVSYARLTPAPCMFDAGILNTAHHIEMSCFFSWGQYQQFQQRTLRCSSYNAEIEPIGMEIVWL